MQNLQVQKKTLLKNNICTYEKFVDTKKHFFRTTCIPTKKLLIQKYVSENKICGTKIV